MLAIATGFGIFSQFTEHYLYRESKRAIIYAHSKVIGLAGKRKPQSEVPGGSITWFATDLSLTDNVSVPVKRWQKTAALGAVFGTLSTRAQPTRLAALTFF
jgi:hypothetical protein